MKTFYDTAYTPHFSRYTIGFDPLLDKLAAFTANTVVKTSNFPPYNVKKLEENKYLIELAVAGYTKTDIIIEYNNGELIVKSNTTQEADSSEYIWQGIAKRAFSHKFTLADTILVKSATMTNGLLKICLLYTSPSPRD